MGTIFAFSILTPQKEGSGVPTCKNGIVKEWRKKNLIRLYRDRSPMPGSHHKTMIRFCLTGLYLAFRIVIGVISWCLLPSLTGWDSVLAEEIAILKSADIGAYSEAIKAYKAHLPPSYKVTLEYNLQGDMSEGRNLARRIRASDADVVLAVGLKAALATKLEILDIPTVFCLVLDPAKYGLPSKNMVGLSLDIPFAQQLKPLQKIVPNLQRLGIIFDPEKTQGMYRRLEKEAKALKIEIISREVGSEQEVAPALRTMEGRIDALWLLPDSTVLTENTLDFLISTTLEANIPVHGFSPGLVQSGVVFSTYLKYEDIGRHAAVLSQDLLEKKTMTKRGTLIPPKKIYQSINTKSAKFLGYSLSPTMLRPFDEHF